MFNETEISEQLGKSEVKKKKKRQGKKNPDLRLASACHMK